MKLARILQRLDTIKIKFLYKTLKNTKDKKCKKILLETIKCGCLFGALQKHIDPLGKLILSIQTYESLNILGDYMIIKHNITKKITLALLYIIFLTIFFIMICILLTKVKIYDNFVIFNKYILILIPMSLIIIFGYYYQRIRFQIKFLIQLKALELFLKQQINKDAFLKICHLQKKQDFLISIEHWSEIVFYVTNEYFSTIDQIRQTFDYKVNNLNNYLDESLINATKTILLIIGLIISFTAISFFNQMSKFLCYT